MSDEVCTPSTFLDGLVLLLATTNQIKGGGELCIVGSRFQQPNTPSRDGKSILPLYIMCGLCKIFVFFT